MKLTLIGGGGVRSLLFVASAVRRHELIDLEEICLMDVSAEKLAVIGPLCQYIAERNSPVKITTTLHPTDAFADAAYVVSSIRVGGEQGRILDERIALRHGVLGQETTGPGGFAMALRTIPVTLEYAKLIKEINPQAWMFNFTNPAGLVTQALQDAGYERTVGICDGANLAQHAVARWYSRDYHDVKAEVYGLNHLSWTRSVSIDGAQVLDELLRDPDFLSSSDMRVFEPEMVEAMGVWMNEYLYYYYYAEKAIEHIQGDEMTRGEEISILNARLIEQLKEIGARDNPEKALKAYQAYAQRRASTYMHYARPDGPTMDQADEQIQNAEIIDTVDDGYAGVALDVIQALESDIPAFIGLNVCNQGAIACMRPDDVVEVTCLVDADGIRPQPIGDIPERHELLMRSVKYYERLTVETVRERSRKKAVLALMSHPLVVSYSLAKTLVDEYLDAHAAHVGEWN